MLTMAMANHPYPAPPSPIVAPPIGPRPKCTACGRKHSARRGLCWGCYQQVLKSKAMPKEPEQCSQCEGIAVRRGMCWTCYDKRRECGVLDVRLYGRVRWVVAIVAMLTPDEATQVRDALAMKATG